MCPWNIPLEQLGTCLREQPKVSDPNAAFYFIKERKHFYLISAPSSFPSTQHKDSDSPTGQSANCPILLHFLVTFFINPLAVGLVWLVSTVIVSIAKKPAIYTPPWEGKRTLSTGMWLLRKELMSCEHLLGTRHFAGFSLLFHWSSSIKADW